MLPASSEIQESAIIMHLPPLVGDWTAGPKEEASEKVKGILQAKAYENRTFRHDLTGQVVRVGIVLSSDNINQSIHRPERCLPAQGHQLLRSTEVTIPIQGTKKPLLVTKLLTERRFENTEGIIEKNKSLTYYCFVGKDSLTNSHFSRTLTDISDRLLRGQSQRWAYVTFDCFLNKDASNEPECHFAVVDILTELFPEIIRIDQLKSE